MGSGKRNYRSLRMSGRKWKKDQPQTIIEEEKKAPSKEDVDKLIALFQKNKKGDKIQ